MYHEKIPARQLTAWLFGAVTPLAIQLMHTGSWLQTLLIAAVSGVAVVIRWCWGKSPEGKIHCVLQYLVVLIVLGTLSGKSIQSWPVGGHVAVPVILLGLAAWSAWKGISAAARVGSVLFWMILAIYTVLIIAAVKEIEPQWLVPQKRRVEWLLWVPLLLPASGAILLKKEPTFHARLILSLIFVTAASIAVAGVLSPRESWGLSNSFYEMTRGLNVMGVARRFEALISAAMTTGWFLYMSLSFSLCAELAEKIKKGWGRRGILLAAFISVIWTLCGMHIPDVILPILAAIFWVMVPLLTQWIGRIKKVVKKRK